MTHLARSLIAAWLSLAGATTGAAESSPPVAPGYAPLAFTLPPPDSYRLARLGKAADGAVLGSNGQGTRLHALYQNHLVVLSFIYATCDDVNGCPLATTVFRKVAARLRQEPALREHVRLLTLSFNPEHDTPAAMAHYGQGLSEGLDWQFLTTRSEVELQPILTAFGQTVEKVVDEQGRFTGTFSHVLRVYLIDRSGELRNSYTTSFLHADTVVNDLKSLLAEEHTEANAPHPAAAGVKSVDLFALSRKPALGLPKLPVPADNRLTAAKVDLGRKLFFDRRLALNGTFSCAMCHVPEQGYASNEQRTAVGIEGRTVRRNSPTIYNVGWLPRLFHDGRETTLEQQVWGPLLAANEMGAPSVGYVVEKIRGLADYTGRFEAAFHRPASMETIGMAIASYERALIAADSPFDRWRYAKAKDAIGESAQRGFALFTGKAGCASCHTVGNDSALFSDGGFHNTGIGYKASMAGSGGTTVTLAPGVTTQLSAAALNAVSEVKPSDLGRYEITQNPKDRWAYRTPSLRNAALTAPYMHDGSLATLGDVVGFYNRGGEPNENLDPLIHPLGLSEQEIADLVAFLNSLTGSTVPALVADGLAAPVGDPR